MDRISLVWVIILLFRDGPQRVQMRVTQDADIILHPENVHEKKTEVIVH